MKKFFVLMSGLVFLLLSCEAPVATTNTGSVALRFDTATRAFINTTQDMNITDYVVTLTTPDNTVAYTENVSVTEADASFTFGPYMFGDYRVDVAGKNVAGEVIFDNKNVYNITVKTGLTVTKTIVVTPVVGTGALTVEVLWDTTIVDNGTVEGTLTSFIGQPLSLAFSAPVSAGGTTLKSTLNADQIDTGYAVMSLKLMHNGVSYARGTTDLVRIANNSLSGVATYDWTGVVNNGGGSFELGIQADLQDPLTVEFAAAPATTYTNGDAVTLTVDVIADMITSERGELYPDPDFHGNFFYVLFDGAEQIGGSVAAVFGQSAVFNFIASNYQYGVNYDTKVTDFTVVAFNEEGTRAGQVKLEGVTISK